MTIIFSYYSNYNCFAAFIMLWLIQIVSIHSICLNSIKSFIFIQRNDRMMICSSSLNLLRLLSKTVAGGFSLRGELGEVQRNNRDK